jgi:hypothetical protein
VGVEVRVGAGAWVELEMKSRRWVWGWRRGLGWLGGVEGLGRAWLVARMLTRRYPHESVN